MALLLAAGSFTSAFADNKLVVKDVSILSGGQAVVSVEMENDADIIGLQAKIKLPQGLKKIVAGQDDYGDNIYYILNNTRTYQKGQKDDNGVTIQRHEIDDDALYDGSELVTIVHRQNRPFLGQSGEIIQFKVQADATLADVSNIELEDVEFTRVLENGVDVEAVRPIVTKAEGYNGEVKKLAEPEGIGILTSSLEEITINPKTQLTFEINLENNYDLMALQMDVHLPKGLKLVEGQDTYATPSDPRMVDARLDPDCNQLDDATWRIAFASTSARRKLAAGSGAIFALIVEADNDLEEGSKITIDNVVLTRPNLKQLTVKENLDIVVHNPNAVAMDAAQLKLDDALAQLNEAKAAVPEYLRPDVSEARATKADAEADAQAAILAATNAARAAVEEAWNAADAAYEALKKEIEEAYEAGTLAGTDYQGKYDASIAADENLKKVAAEQDAKVEAVKVEAAALVDAYGYIDEQWQAYTDAVNAVPESVKENEKVVAAEGAVRTAIQALQTRIDDAYKAGNLADTDLDVQKQNVEDAIANIAKVAQQAVIDNLKAEVAKLQAALDGAKSTISGYPIAAEFEDQIEEIQGLIDGESQYIEDNKETLNDEYKVDEDGAIAAAIQKLKDDAFAENAKYVANEDAKKRLDNDIANLEKTVEEALAEIEAEAPNTFANFEEEQQAVADAIDAIKKGVEEKYNNRELDAASQIDPAAVNAALAELEEKAVAAQQAEDKAIADTKADLQEKLDAANEDLEAAKEKLQEVLDNEDYELTEEDVADLKQEIENLEGEAEILQNAIDEGAKERTLLDPEQVKFVEDAIAEQQENVDGIAEKVDGIEAEQKAIAEAKAANEAAREEYKEALEPLAEKYGELRKQLDDLLNSEDSYLSEDSEDYELLDGALDELDEAIQILENALEVGEDFTSDEAKELIEGQLEEIAGEIEIIESGINTVEQTHKAGNVDGDADGEVDIFDFMEWQYLVNEIEQSGRLVEDLDPATEEFRKLDVNRDGRIGVGDIRALVNLQMYGSITGAPAEARTISTVAENLFTTVNGNNIALNLTSDAAYAGLQADVVLPEGTTFKGATLTGRTEGFTLMTTQIGNTTRIRVITMENITFSGNEGALLNIEVEGNANATVQNVIVADVTAAEHQLEVANAQTTGIAGVNAAAANGEQVYSLSGRVMNALKKGINIIRRADGTTQKVMK